MSDAWVAAMERARAASDAAGYTAEMAARARFRFTVDFTISHELVDLVDFEMRRVGRDAAVHVVFDGTEEARERVCDVVAQLPSVRRTYRMSYEPGEGVVSGGIGQAGEAVGQA